MNNMQHNPYPRFCPECGNDSVNPGQICYQAKLKHDGKLHEFEVSDLPIDVCGNCGEQWFTTITDDALQNGLRDHLCFLHPNQIKARLRDLSISQTEFANRIGVAPETVSRWLNGHAIQSRAMDNLIRLFLGIEIVREVLREAGPVEGLGVVRTQSYQMQWVLERSFSPQVARRRDTFQLRDASGVSYVR